MTSAPRNEAAGPTRDPLTALRVGQFYYHLGNRRLYALNDAARDLREEGVPLNAGDPAVRDLRTPGGAPVSDDGLPLSVAVREKRPAEAEFVLARPGLPQYHLHCSAAPLKDSTGRVVAVLVSLTASPPPPDWPALAGLAHDLGTPLHTVGLLLAALDSPALTAEERAEALARLRSAAERAQQIGKDLLEWCRAPGLRGRVAPPAWFPLEPFLAELVAEQSPAAARRGLTLGTALEAAWGWQIYTDRVRLGRILANLLVNAVRYTPPGGRVTLSAARQDQGDERFLALSVADTGAGISQEEQESIFQPYLRGQSGRDSDSIGSGIGLAVVDRLTEELGLRRDLSSETGRGSTFRILVPQRLLRMLPPSSASPTA